MGARDPRDGTGREGAARARARAGFGARLQLSLLHLQQSRADGVDGSPLASYADAWPACRRGTMDATAFVCAEHVPQLAKAAKPTVVKAGIGREGAAQAMVNKMPAPFRRLEAADSMSLFTSSSRKVVDTQECRRAEASL